MKRMVFAALFCAMVSATAFGVEPKFKKLVLSEEFNTEGATAADFNNDGVTDIVAGHFWYEGPEFKVKHQLYEGENFNPEGYSNSFVNFAYDFNHDGWMDVLICPHPGVTGYWYENPKGEEKFWTAHEATIELGNESQDWVDIDGDGEPELIFNRNGKYGYAKPNAEKPYDPWTFVQVSTDNEKYQRYFHGVGSGDLNGDGRVDMLEMDGWWEQPEKIDGKPWKFHEFKFSDAASHMLVYDVDGDGLNDVICATHCHLYGLAWFKQVRDANGEISFEKNVLIPSDPADDFFPLVSQLHSFYLIDMNGDGVQDFVTGKRYLAHGSQGDVKPLDPPILMWWEIKRGENGAAPTITPHIIDDASGVGTQVWAGEVNGDGKPDVVVGNKKGVFAFLSE